MMLLKNLKNRLIRGGVYLTLIGFGYAIARFVAIPYFEVDRSIDISNVFTLLLTVWLAILVTTVLEKQTSNNRVEKDIIISRVADVYSIVSSLQSEFSVGKIHVSEVSSSIKRINTAVQAIYKISTKCRIEINSELKSNFKICLSDLRDISTNTPVVTTEQLSSKDLPIEIKDSIIYYNRDRISQIEVKFEQLKDYLLELQIDINRR